MANAGVLLVDIVESVRPRMVRISFGEILIDITPEQAAMFGSLTIQVAAVANERNSRDAGAPDVKRMIV